MSPENPAFAEFAKVKTLDDLDDVNFYVQAIVEISQSFAPNPKAPLLADLPFGVADGDLETANTLQDVVKQDQYDLAAKTDDAAMLASISDRLNNGIPFDEVSAVNDFATYQEEHQS